MVGGIFFFLFLQSSWSRVSGGGQWSNVRSKGATNGEGLVREIQAGRSRLRHLSCRDDQKRESSVISRVAATMGSYLSQLAVRPRLLCIAVMKITG